MTAIPAWGELRRPDDVADGLVALFAEAGDDPYDEAVSQTVHAVQAAQFAEAEDAPPALVVAALLHDIGHLLAPGSEEVRARRDLRHELVAARFLATWFGPEVVEPIRWHVAAKRYLCAVEPGYADALSPASVQSLQLQGGVMTADEVETFRSTPGAADAVRLRRWDDLAKDPERPTPGVERYRSVLVSVLATGPASGSERPAGS